MCAHQQLDGKLHGILICAISLLAVILGTSVVHCGYLVVVFLLFILCSMSSVKVLCLLNLCYINK